MKKKISIIVGMLLLLASCMVLAACSQWEAPYASLAKNEGYTVKVYFDSNGGKFAGTEGLKVVDVYSPDMGSDAEGGKKAITLIAPDDERKDSRAMDVSREGYFLAGWYTERSLRVDENGNALDAWGQLTSVSGNEQGYTYSGHWNFASDKLVVDPDKTYAEDEYALTLYAAWVPYFEYEIYAENNGEFEKLDALSVQTLDFKSPSWEGETAVQISMNSMPKRTGYTLIGAYTDKEMKNEMSGTYDYKTLVDYEKGIAYQSIIPIYTVWEEGNRYNIYTAKQLMDNVDINGTYDIKADLDFSNITYWPLAFSKGNFQGKIIGNGHKLSNITAAQADSDSSIYCGLFGKLSEKAELLDVTFENVNFTIKGSLKPDFQYGLLAGSIEDAATIEGVSISGNLIISSDWYSHKDYEIGLLCATGNNHGIDTSAINCIKDNEENPLYITFTDEGKIVVSTTPIEE